MANFYCYILKNDYNNRTYNGFTVNPARRIRQHNQEIKGGAKYTSSFGNKSWEIYVLITGFPDMVNALQCEWRIKHPDNKRTRPNKYNSPMGRIIGLSEVLRLKKWTEPSTKLNADSQFTVWIKKGFENLLTDLPNNITIIVVDTIDLKNLKIPTIVPKDDATVYLEQVDLKIGIEQNDATNCVEKNDQAIDTEQNDATNSVEQNDQTIDSIILDEK